MRLLRTITFIWFSLNLTSIDAQNLIPNPSFELINICKKYAEPCSPKGWRTTTLKLPRYNDSADQPSLLQSHSLNLLLKDKARNFDRKFIQCELICPIEAGKEYQLSFYIKSKTPVAKELNFLLSNEMYLATTNKQIEELENFATIPLPKLKKEGEWEKVDFEFIANSNATHLLIGNLESDENTKFFAPDIKRKRALSKKYEPQSRIEYSIDNIELVSKDTASQADCNREERLEHIFADHYRHQLIQHKPEKTPNIPVAKIAEDSAEILIDKTPSLPAILSKSINVLEGVEFTSNTTKLTQESYPNLDEIKNALIDFPKVNIKIIGHTDNVGTELDNLALSTKRARFIHDYLVNEGIHPSRLQFKGEGESSPIASNDSEEGRQLNRRVEIEIIKLENLD